MSGLKLCFESKKADIDKPKPIDQSFMLHLCKVLNIKINYNDDIISAGGFANLKNIKPKFDEAKNNGKKVLLIFDADRTGIKSGVDNGGFNERKKYLLSEKEKLSIDFELFLFPNDKDDGDFEDLLEQIVNEKHRVKIKCFECYEACLRQYKDDGKYIYKLPAQKSKMYAYMDTFIMTEKEEEDFKKNNWFFDNKEYWNLDSECLQPLKDFLISNSKN